MLRRRRSTKGRIRRHFASSQPEPNDRGASPALHRYPNSSTDVPVLFDQLPGIVVCHHRRLAKLGAAEI